MLVILLTSCLFNSHYCSHKNDWFLWKTPIDEKVLPFPSFVDTPVSYVHIKNGHFYKNNKRLKFFGTTIGWNFLNSNNETMQRAVRYMKNVGINIVRIHPLGLWNGNSLDPKQLERLDFLVYTLRKNKILYSFYSGVTIVVYPEKEPVDINIRKAKVFVDSTTQKKVRKFFKLLLLHVNKYTGIKYVDDKYLAFLILTNENSLYKILQTEDGIKFLSHYIPNVFSPFKERKLDSKMDLDKLCSLLNIKEQDFFINTKLFLREIGLKVPIAFTNNLFNYYTQKVQYDYADFICVHSYGRYTYTTKKDLLKNENPLIWDEGIPLKFPTKILEVNYLNKPVIVDEWNIGYPIDYRGVAPILVSVFSSLYDYDGIFYFSFFENQGYLDKPYDYSKFYWTSLEQPFSPTVVGQFPILSYLFRNSIIKPFKDSTIVEVNEKDALTNSKIIRWFSPFSGIYSKMFYLKRVILKFSDSSNRIKIMDHFKKLGNEDKLKTDRYFWNYKSGSFLYLDDQLIIFAGDPNGLDKKDLLSSTSDFFILEIYALDNKKIFFSDSILIFVASDDEYIGDYLKMAFFIGRKVGHPRSYLVPSKKEYLKMERIPGITLVKPTEVEISLPKQNGEYFLACLDPSSGNFTRLETDILFINEILHLTIDQHVTKSLYFMLRREKFD